MTDLVPVEINQEKVLATLGIQVNNPVSQAVMLVCQKYNLAPELKHVTVIASTPYITKTGYLHIAHRSGVFDGIDILDHSEGDKTCTAKVAVYRKDMGRPFVAVARFKVADAKGRDPMDMALARATRRALMQAFDVADVFGNADDVHDIDSHAPREWVPEDLAPAKSNIGPLNVGPLNAGPLNVDKQRAQAVIEAVTADPEPVVQSGAAGGVPTPMTIAVDEEPFPDDIPTPDPNEAVDKVIGIFPGAHEETGEVSDEVTRRRLLGDIDKLDGEQRKAFQLDWKKAKLGSLRDTAKGPKLLVSQVSQAEALIAAAMENQAAVYDRRRKAVMAKLGEVGIATDEARHELVKDATGGATESTKALTAAQYSAIVDAIEGLRAIDNGDEFGMFPDDDA